MNRRIVIGFALLGLVALVVLGGELVKRPPLCEAFGTCPQPAVTPPPSVAVLKGLACGSKQGMLANPDVQRILLERYQIGKVECQTAGSEVCRDEVRLKGQDFVWPAGLYWLEECRKTLGRDLEYDVTFITPIVFYSWDCVTDELVRRGQVRQVDGVYYIPDLPDFTKKLLAGAKWQGECGIFSRLVVIPTDPTKSASGAEFVALMAGALNDNEVVDEVTLIPLLPQLVKYILSLGKLDETSGKLFPNCIKKGMGACPLFTVYESQGIDFINANPDERKMIIDRFRILYPQPTALAEHEIIALTANGKKFMQAMKDKDIQDIAWRKHGFRTGSLGDSDPTVFGFPGIPRRIDVVIPSPRGIVFDMITDCLKGRCRQLQ